MKLKSVLCVVSLLIASWVTAETVNLEEVLTPEQFKEFGLEKLSKKELNRLSDWFFNRDAAPVVVAPPKPDPVKTFGQEQLPEYVRKKPENTASNEIRSRLVGESNGWEGYTRFKLQNGQTWRQTDGERFFISKVNNPEVIIKRGIFGTYQLRFKGYNSFCRVQRVE